MLQFKDLFFFIFFLLSSVIFIKYVQIHLQASKFTLLKNECLKKQRENFINIVTHDLRIPVIAQIRALDILNNDSIGNLSKTQKEIIEQIKNSCNCNLNLMSLLINTYNLENNNYSFCYEKFNISDVIISCFNELSNDATEKNITFEYCLESNNIYITGDKKEIKKVFYNLISTALATSKFGTKVTVIFKRIGAKIRFGIYSSDKNNNFTELTNNMYATIGQNIKLNFCEKIMLFPVSSKSIWPFLPKFSKFIWLFSPKFSKF